MFGDSRHPTDTGPMSPTSPTSPRDSNLSVPPEVPPKNSPPIPHKTHLRSAGMRYLDSLGSLSGPALGSVPPPPPPPVPPPPFIPPTSGEWYAPGWYAPPPPVVDPLALVPDDLDKSVPSAWQECVGGDRLVALCLWRGLRGSTRLRFHIVEGYVRFLKTQPTPVQPYLPANPAHVETWVARRANDRLKDGVASPEFVKTELLAHVDFLIDIHREIGLKCSINRARAEMVVRGAMRLHGCGEDDAEQAELAQVPAEDDSEKEKEST